MIEMQDFRNALLELGIFLSKQDLSFLFRFIDSGEDNFINYHEFKDFWLLQPDDKRVKALLLSNSR